jgi:uncharacterized protein
MKIALEYLKKNEDFSLNKYERSAALAAGLLHDIGHGPFSHVLEKSSKLNHEKWTENIILSDDTEVYSILKKLGRDFPGRVVKLLFHPSKKASLINALLSSQVDVDRIDYLLRDSYFCGISYGNFDYRWIFHTMRVGSISSSIFQPIWVEKAIRALEDYIFARYNMYWAVYYHRTTRGYEELLKAILRRAKASHEEGKKINFISNQLRKFILQEKLSCDEYLSIDDSVLLSQITLWTESREKTLSDLCNRFISRKGLKWVDYREDKNNVSELREREDARTQIKRELKNKGYDPEYYFLDSISAAKAYDYYHPEKETGDRSAKNSIFITNKDNEKTEISARPEMGRLRVLTGTKEIKKYYYVPQECRSRVADILDKM